MILKVFCIYDSKAESYLVPFFMRSKGEAIRAITTHVNDAEHNFSKFAEDFALFELGSWDDDSAKFDLHAAPQSLGLLHEFRKPA